MFAFFRTLNISTSSCWLFNSRIFFFPINKKSPLNKILSIKPAIVWRILFLGRFLWVGLLWIFFEKIKPNLCLLVFCFNTRRVKYSEKKLFPFLKTALMSFSLLSLYFLASIYKVTRFRPFFLLLARIFLPDFVRLLFRKPCTFFLLRFFGCQVLLGILVY